VAIVLINRNIILFLMVIIRQMLNRNILVGGILGKDLLVRKFKPFYRVCYVGYDIIIKHFHVNNLG